MNNKIPLVSVIIPTFNSADTILESIDSVLDQFMRDFEVIVVDDGSTDDTYKLLESYKNQIKYIYQENKGRSAARNKGISIAQGKYIAFLDSDDTWLPNRLSRQIPILEENPEIVLIYSKAKVINAQGNDQKVCDHIYEIGKGESKPSNIYNQLLRGNIIPILTVTLRRTVLGQTGLFDENLSYPEDWDLCIRVSRYGKIYFLPEILACYRIIDENRSARFYSSQNGIEQQLALLEKNINEHGITPPELTHSARAWVFARAAISATQLSNPQSSYGYWLDTLHELPSFFDGHEVEKLIQKAVFAAHLLVNKQGYEGGSKFLQQYASILPVRRNKRKQIKRALLSQYQQDILFLSHKKKDYKTVRKYILTGLIKFPKWVVNRGLLKILYSAIIDCIG